MCAYMHVCVRAGERNHERADGQRTVTGQVHTQTLNTSVILQFMLF